MPLVDQFHIMHYSCFAKESEAKQMGTYATCCACTNHDCPIPCSVCHKPIEGAASISLHGSRHVTCPDPHIVSERSILEKIIKAAEKARKTSPCCACHNAPELAYIRADSFIAALKEELK